MKAQAVNPILNVSSMEESFAWFEKLGWQKSWSWGDPVEFAAVISDKVEIFLCLNCQGTRSTTKPRHPFDGETGGTWLSLWVSSPKEVDEVHALAVKNEIEVTFPPNDMPWSVREFHVRHPDGHTFRIGAGLPETEE
ncbi:MAG: bleomycin resistance family protein [Gemmatimonadales bacterium]